MMPFDWQLVIALSAVALAAGYVIYTLARSLRGRHSGCGECGTCSAEKPDAAASRQLVVLGENDENAARL
jgi:hypothetical protein